MQKDMCKSLPLLIQKSKQAQGCCWKMYPRKH